MLIYSGRYVRRLRRRLLAAEANFKDLRKPPAGTVYKDKAGRWRWKIETDAGKAVALGQGAWDTRAEAVDACREWCDPVLVRR